MIGLINRAFLLGITSPAFASHALEVIDAGRDWKTTDHLPTHLNR
jgi:hypothetical protein